MITTYSKRGALL